MALNNVDTPKAAPKYELLFNKLSSEALSAEF